AASRLLAISCKPRLASLIASATDDACPVRSTLSVALAFVLLALVKLAFASVWLSVNTCVLFDMLLFSFYVAKRGVSQNQRPLNRKGAAAGPRLQIFLLS